MTRRRWKIFSAAAVVVLLATGAVIWVTHRNGETPAATAGVPSAAPRAGSRCGLPGTPGNPTQIRARWENVAGWYLPVSVTDGPFRRSPTGAWSCFAHTPTGAVLAGYIIAMRVDGLAEDRQTAIKEQTVPGPGQTAKLASQPQPAAGVVSLRGFTVAGYSDDRATIAYYLHQGTTDLSCTANVVWYSQDWRLQLEDNGDTLSGCTQGVPASFVPWGPTP